jgi:cell division protease FtsH
MAPGFCSRATTFRKPTSSGREPPAPAAEETAAAIDQEVRSIVQSVMDRALAILRDKREVLECSARKLLEKEALDESDLAALIGPPAEPPIRVAAE